MYCLKNNDLVLVKGKGKKKRGEDKTVQYSRCLFLTVVVAAHPERKEKETNVIDDFFSISYLFAPFFSQ